MMQPSMAIFRYQYLLTGLPGELTEPEITEFQRWLDDDQDGLTPPLCVGKPSPDNLCKANRLVAHYCRYRHNDWSAEWINKHMPRTPEGACSPLGTFCDWLDDLIRLCRSHHFGRVELECKDFNPRLVGQPGQVLHLRYLACVLRVADVLEFDPERTPRVILFHRDIAPGSLIFWHKDREISLRFERPRFVLAARPATARLYRAVEEMLDEIDNELTLCRTLADETHFEICPGLTEALPHTWQLTSAVHRDLKPRPDTFVYINSAFRPNTEKILQMFSGIELYVDHHAAVRELLQNAFDAVREQIAYQRLRNSHPSDATLEKVIGKQHRVELRLEQRSDGLWLVCSDGGVGMNRRIIQDYLLVSGHARRHDVVELERRCQKAGFSAGRTGQFGIGVLSYFMIADRLRVTTRRSLEPMDEDGTGWIFETEGIGSWGELRPDKSIKPGTRVELHLKHEVVANATAWYADLRKYLSATLMYLPCEFQFNSALPGCEPIAFDPGWSMSVQDWSEMSVRNIANRVKMDKKLPRHLLPSRAQVEEQEREQRWYDLQAKARDSLRWITREGELPDGLGRYRLHLPYFNLLGGESLAFMETEASQKGVLLGKIGAGCAYKPDSRIQLSWKGMRVSLSGTGRQRMASRADLDYPFEPIEHMHLSMLETDFHSDSVGKLQINRAGIILDNAGIACLDWLREQERSMTHDFLIDHSSSIYTTLNLRYGELPPVAIQKPYWIVRYDPDTRQAGIWGAIRFPAVDSRTWTWQPLPKKLTWKGRGVSILTCISGPHDDDHYDGTPWYYPGVQPDRILRSLSFPWRMSVAMLWERNPLRAPLKQPPPFASCRFSPKWKHVTGMLFNHSMHKTKAIWNPAHTLVRLVTEQAISWVVESDAANRDPLDLGRELSNDVARIAAWILKMLESGEAAIWNGLNERNPRFLKDLWTVLYPNRQSSVAPTPLAFWVEETHRSRLRVVTPESWRTLTLENAEEREECDQLMPDPGPAWTLVSDDDRGEDLGVG